MRVSGARSRASRSKRGFEPEAHYLIVRADMPTQRTRSGQVRACSHVPQHPKRPPGPARNAPMALELADADGRNPHLCRQADRWPVNILAGEDRASNTVDHGAALVAASASAVSNPERSALRAIGSSPRATAHESGGSFCSRPRSRNEAFRPKSITYKSEPAMRTDRTRSGAVRASSRLTLVIAREIELFAARRGRLMGLDVEDIEAVAEHIAQLVESAPPRVGLVDAQALADQLGVARDWVYANAERLGVVRLGTARAAALRRRAGARGIGGGRGGRPVKAWRSAAAPAWTVSR